MERAAVSIVSKVGQMLVDELQDIRGIGDKVIHLRDELATMNAALRIISEADQDTVDHLAREWEKQVHDLAYDAEDCADTYSLRIVRPTPRPPNDVAGNQLIFSWARYLVARAKRVARYPYEKLVLQRTLAADIKALLARTTVVSERRARYGIDRAALPRSACLAPVSAASFSTNALHGADDPDQFVGIVEQANDLADKIKAIKGLAHQEDDKIKEVHHEDERSLKVLSIVGFGGLGKTTLAMELCRQLDADFPCQAKVSVSQAFDVEKDMKGLLVRVLQQISKEKADQSNEMRVEVLSSKIKELLNRTRCLIVVDDVWSLPAWEAIRIRMFEKNCSSKIIVTTRIEAVAKAASTSEYFVHHMKPLEPEASKKLFINRVFGSTKKDTCPSELKVFMDTVLKKCGGLPLAIVSIASLLASYKSVQGIEMWERVSRSIGSQMESHPTLEGMRQLITLSYDYLPHHLKACMMYLSIFPEDYVIPKNRLLYRWIAEGLITDKRGLTLLEVADEYFSELISRNMIQVYKFASMGVNVEGCRVHDMILEVVVSKSQESNFVSLVGRQYGGMPHGHGKVRRLSIHDNDHVEQGPKKVLQHHARHGIEAMKLHHVRSLTTFQRDYGPDKLLERLGEFKLLRVLDLEDCKALRNKHMRDVCRLYFLRFLSLKGTNVSMMPDKIGNLEHLETLDIEYTGIRGELPQTVTKLSKLERIKCTDWILPRGLGNMKALRDVDTGILIGNDVEVAKEIGELPQLQILRIAIGYVFKKAELKEGVLSALASSLSTKHTLRSLTLIRWDGIGEFLLGISTPPLLLQCLGVYGPIIQLPNWISLLTHLTKFKVGHTELVGDQLFGVLSKLPNLESIQLVQIDFKDGELVARPEHSFPVLRILEVLGYLTMLIFEEGSMTKLETLELFFENKETRIVGLENMKNLNEVKLHGVKGNPSMERAVEQLKDHPNSNQIKAVVDWR